MFQNHLVETKMGPMHRPLMLARAKAGILQLAVMRQSPPPKIEVLHLWWKRKLKLDGYVIVVRGHKANSVYTVYCSSNVNV